MENTNDVTISCRTNLNKMGVNCTFYNLKNHKEFDKRNYSHVYTADPIEASLGSRSADLKIEGAHCCEATTKEHIADVRKSSTVIAKESTVLICSKDINDILKETEERRKRGEIVNILF